MKKLSSTTNLSETVTTGEAASMLGVSRQRVSDLIHEGILPATRFVGRWAVSRYAVQAMTQKASQHRFHITTV